MSWFFETRVRDSEKNGRIIATRRLGSWWVTVDGCGETTPGLHYMWEDALQKTALYTGLPPVTRVLMLGLGAGGEIKTIRRFFPKSTITAVEHDPEMVALSKELKLYAPGTFPRVMCEDAQTALMRLKEEFDLIVIDMFKGPTPSPLSGDPLFQKTLNERLAPGGLIVVNVYKHEQLLDELAKGLWMVKKWRFGTNYLGLFGKREVAECLLENYRPVRAWPDYDPIPFMQDLKPVRVPGATPGIYWRFGLFSFEKYVGDTVPDVKPLSKDMQRLFRIIMWQRLTLGERSPGWISFSDGPSHTFPILRLSKEYWSGWDESAKRSRRKWHATFSDSVYRIEEGAYDEFVDAYTKSTLPLSIKYSMPTDIRIRMKKTKAPVSFLLARRIKDGKVVAGIAHTTSEVLPISYYIAGFYLDEVRHHPLMIGLIDHWAADAIRRGTRFIDLGYVWRKGRDRSWRGLSTFKAKFNPIYFFFPSLVYRFEFNLPFQKS